MKIYTKTGDQGETSLIGGQRVKKSHERIQAYGSLDELNSWMGLLAEYTIIADQKPLIRSMQHELFVIGSHLAMSSESPSAKTLPALDTEAARALEEAIDAMNEVLEPMRFFVLPGGHKEIAFVHIARTVCRRAEREIIALSASEPVEETIIITLNRLSDYIFVLARYMTMKLGVSEIPWIPKKLI